jgi:tRNA uridine 5-carbamoylmethylation protein Kti12
VTIPHGADQIQPEAQNNKGYAESQQQRALERRIRAQKRELEALGDMATDDDRAKLRQYQADMREFINQTGRTRRYDREQIGG